MKQTVENYQKIIIALAISFAGTVLHAQVIDPLNGTGGISYTTYLVNDTSSGAGTGVSFTQSGAGLQANYVGTGTAPEQALSLASASSFSTVFAVGDTLELSSTVAASSTTEDFGLAISANNPIAGSAGNYNTRTSFDWASISIRPSASSSVGDIRQNQSISGSFGSGNIAGVNPTLPVNGLFISWIAPLQFTLGYINSSGVLVPEDTITFSPGSTIGSEIGFYGDLRGTSTSLGDFSNLSIVPVPEPATWSLIGLGLVGVAGLLRRKSK